MKKVIALALAFILAAVSCSGKNSEPEQVEIGQTEPVVIGEGDTVVTVGSFGIRDPLMEHVSHIPEGIAVKYINFSDGYGFDPYHEYDPERAKAVKRELDKDVAKGNVPDILLLDANDVQRLNRLGALADLGELMDKYDCGIKRDELTDAALAGLTVDGRIPALIQTYSIRVPVAKAKFVPHEYENWTVDDAMEFFDNMPEWMTYVDHDYDGARLADIMLRCEYKNCIDEENAACDFSGKFAEILQFCKEHPGEAERMVDYANMTREEQIIYDEEKRLSVLKDEKLVYYANFINKYPEQEFYDQFLGQDMTFVGYPSENGCGAEVYYVGNIYCISEHCADKEAAWKLLSKMVKTNYNANGDLVDGPFGISIFRKWTKNNYNEFVANITGTVTDIVPREYYERIFDKYTKIPVDIYKDYTLWNMVWEECEPVLKGSRTVEEAVKLLNNRVGIYLSERS